MAVTVDKLLGKVLLHKHKGFDVVGTMTSEIVSTDIVIPANYQMVLQDILDVQATLDVIGSLYIINHNIVPYERHIQIPAFLSGTPASQPTAITIGTAAGLQFPSNADKTVGIQWEIPDDWDGGDCYLEVDWFPDSGNMSGTDTVKWDIRYTSIAEGETITQGTTVTVSVTEDGDYNQYVTRHSRATLDFDNANQPMNAQDHMYFTITRDTSVANDFSGTVVVTAFEIIYNSINLPTSN